jgi:hypothetical protein
MKKITVILILSLFASISYAQLFTIEPTNPAPRVGDKISVSYKIDPEAKFDIVKNIIVKPGETCQTSNRYILTGNLVLNQKLENTDDVKVGPIIIDINGKQYKSDSITLKVLPTLPDVDEGFWIQCVELQKTCYLVLEQRIPVVAEQRKTDLADIASGNQMIMGQELCASIDSKSIKIEGVKEISQIYRTMSTVRPKDIGKKPYTIYTTIYKVTLDGYKNNGELTKTDFYRLPENLNFKPVKIKFNNPSIIF